MAKKLPKSVIMTDNDLDEYTLENITEQINDYLYNKYGRYVSSCGWSVKIEIDDITWHKKGEI